MYKRLALLFLIGLLLLSGCQAASNTVTRQSAGGQPESAPAAPAMEAPQEPKSMDSYNGAAGGSTGSGPINPAAQTIPTDKRMVIRNATLTLLVDDPGQVMNAIASMAETMDGFVVSSNLYKTSSGNGKEYPEANITVRVPATRLNEALDLIKKQVKDPKKDVSSENISGQDVTKEYTDLQSREKNLEQAEAQLREILASATKTEDVLAIYNQLTQVREQIEVLKGQIKYYEESAALSSIAVTIHAAASVQPLEIGGWQPVGVARNAVQALINTMQVVGNAAIWLALYVLPVALVIFIPLRFLWWLLRRGQKNRKTPTAVPPPSVS